MSLPYSIDHQPQAARHQKLHANAATFVPGLQAHSQHILRAEAPNFVPGYRAHLDKPWPSVGPYSGPDHLVGRPYKDLNPEDFLEIKKFRLAHDYCEECGFNKHRTKDCPHLERKRKYCERHFLCLECLSPQHEFDQCPVRLALDKSLGARAEWGTVRDRMAGWAYKYMSAAEKADIPDYRYRHRRCITCGDVHEWYECERRKMIFKKRMARKRRDIASGKLVLATEFTSDLARLPKEIRLLIWGYLTQDDEVISIRQGYINKFIYRYGLPFEELLHTWLRNNIFELQTTADRRRFGRMLDTFHGQNSVHAIQVPLNWLDSQQHGGLPRKLRIQDLIQKCTFLSKVTFVVDFFNLHSWGLLNHPIRIPSEAAAVILDQDVLGRHIDAALRDLAHLGHFRGLAILDRDTVKHGMSIHDVAVQKIVQHIKAIFAGQGRSDIVVCGIETHRGNATWERI